MATLYAILEDGKLLDGELFTADRLTKVLAYADYDAEVFATDFDEARADGSTPTRLVTEDVVNAWVIEHDGWDQIYGRIEDGLPAPGLALRFFPDECAAHEALVERAA